jgi:hypothetical protein
VPIQQNYYVKRSDPENRSVAIKKAHLML